MIRIAFIASATLLMACQPAGQDSAETKDNTVDEPRADSVVAVAPTALAECPEADADGHIAIADGLNATILKKGYGRTALRGDRVTVNARLWVYDSAADGGKGIEVWDSGANGFTFDIGASGFIDGWNPGVACMLIGEKRELIIATALAYGEKGRDPIPSNADIIYELELASIESANE